MVSLWPILHDGELESVSLDPVSGVMRLRFDVLYVREFHALPESTRFTVEVHRVEATRTQGITWADFAGCPSKLHSVSDADFTAEPHGLCLLRLGVMIEELGYAEAFVQGGALRFLVSEAEVPPEEFVRVGSEYWDAFGRSGA